MTNSENKCPICEYRVVELLMTEAQYNVVFRYREDRNEDDGPSWNGKCMLCGRDVTYSPVISPE